MLETDKNNLAKSWAEIESSIDTLTKVEGGFTAARRGIVTLQNGEQVFVKVGVNDQTNKWHQKEVSMYEFLQSYNYPFVPRLLAYNQDKTGFALEPLTTGNSWDWSGISTSDRLTKTLEAMDKLAALTPSETTKEQFDIKTIFEYDNGWQSLVSSETTKATLLGKLRDAGHNNLAESLDFNALAKQSGNFVFSNDVLVHNDVRGDNCAWNPKLQTVKLVDWNWAGFGDKRIDVNAVLVSAQNNGLDVIHDFADRLDIDALVWLSGFWLNSAGTPIWQDGPDQLRDFQLQSGVVALSLITKLPSHV